MNIAIVTGASSGMGREFVLQLGQYVTVDEIWVIARRRAAKRRICKADSHPSAFYLYSFRPPLGSLPFRFGELLTSRFRKS